MKYAELHARHADPTTTARHETVMDKSNIVEFLYDLSEMYLLTHSINRMVVIFADVLAEEVAIRLRQMVM